MVNSHLVCNPTIRQLGFDLSRQQWSLLNCFRMEQGHCGYCGTCRRKWRLTDTDLCPCGETQTMSHTVESCLLANWMAAYLCYTLRMKKLFRGWPVMVHDTHTRRRRSIISVIIFGFFDPYYLLFCDYKVVFIVLNASINCWSKHSLPLSEVMFVRWVQKNPFFI